MMCLVRITVPLGNTHLSVEHIGPGLGCTGNRIYSKCDISSEKVNDISSEYPNYTKIHSICTLHFEWRHIEWKRDSFRVKFCIFKITFRVNHFYVCSFSISIFLWFTSTHLEWNFLCTFRVKLDYVCIFSILILLNIYPFYIPR